MVRAELNWAEEQNRGEAPMLKNLVWIGGLCAMSLTAVERPRIVGIANIAVKVDNLEEARTFYTGVVGLDEAFAVKDAAVAGDLACFKVNDRQFVEVSPTLKGDEDRLIRIGFETADARRLRDYLAEKGVAVPATVGSDANGNRSFTVQDPDGHTVQFVQYMPGSVHSRDAGKHLGAARISDHMIHVGVRVVDPEKSDRFYKDILGFRLQWKGGPNDNKFEWISLMVPDGFDWIEYMVRETQPSPQQLGVLHHYALGTLDVQKIYKTVVERGYTPPREPAIARDGRWLLQLYDKNFTRTEMMIRKPVQTPCCSPNLDDYK
jgi:catechol 2,3-dioxygenase-like lactoylglutathione lyase family enzyme